MYSVGKILFKTFMIGLGVGMYIGSKIEKAIIERKWIFEHRK